MKFYLLAGEESGDLHGSNLAYEILKKEPSAKIRGFGGDKMNQVGVKIIKHIYHFSFMGFTQVIKNLYTIKKNLNFCKHDIISFNPDAIILIDFAGFNMKIARFAKEKGIKVFYYIPPKAWAWNKNRIKLLKKYIDELIVIFPFELDYFKKEGLNPHYFGNPISEEIKKKTDIFSINTNKSVISILPGSREQEIKRNLPRILSVIPKYPNYQFVIASTEKMYDLCNKLSQNKNVIIVKNKTYSVLRISKLALVTSGTATLETAMLNIPQVVCYKTDVITYFLGKILIKIKWISLVNIIMKKEVVKELIQNKMTKKNLISAIDYLLLENGKNQILKDYKKLQKILDSNNVSKKISEFILKSI